jgi:ABC-type transporter MlaC component
MRSNNEPIKEGNHMKKLFTFVVAAIIALSFSAVGFAQEKPAAGTDQPAASAPAPAKKAPAKKKAKKAKKSTKKAAAPAAPEATPAK